ncbi:MAG: glycoside hydrolase, partial [Halobacteriales archaeon]|nr:glycoside hydrolase [Halobacteriales archaeon]
LVLCLLLLAPALAGCAAPKPSATQDPPPDATPPGMGTQPPVNNTPAPPPKPRPQRISFGGPSNEVSIAVDPKNPDRILVGAKDYSLFFAPPCPAQNVWAGVYISNDGGRFWRHTVIPGFPRDPRPSVLAGYRCASDPEVAFDNSGNAYYVGLAFGNATDLNDTQLPPSPVPPPVPVPPPPAMPNASLPVQPDPGPSVIFLGKSKDGLTWDVHTVFGGEPGSINVELTRPVLAIDPQGQGLWMAWTTAAGLPVDPGLPVGVGVGSIMVARSTDGGATWSPPVTVASTSAPAVLGGAPNLAARADGSLLLTWVAAAPDGTDSTILSAVSTDGGQTFGPPATVATIVPVPSPLPNSKFRVANFLELALDTGTGPLKGSAYLAWNDHATGTSKVLVAASKDGGATWSAPKMVQAEGTRNDQFLPALSVAPNGDVQVLFYDRRDDSANRLIVPWTARSADGGATWNETALDFAPFDGDLSLHQNGQPFLGDYIGLAPRAGGSMAVFTATPFGRADVFVQQV